MEELLAKLRKDYLIAFLPTIALFVIALCIGRFTEPMTDLVTAVRIMIVLLLFTLTQDSNDIYLVVIISLLILLYYPSRAFIEKQIGE